MKIIKLTNSKRQEVIKEALTVLKRGDVIVYPTETAYGLGADFFNPQAVRKVYQIKRRQFKKPLSVIVSSLAMARQLVKFNKISLGLAKRYWPGPLTLILNFQFSIFNEFKIQNYKTLGLRISSNKLATAIVRKLGRPMTATSANLAAKSECYSINEVISQFKNRKYQPDLLIDAGSLPRQKVSTVVQVVDGQVKVLRGQLGPY